MPPNGFEKIQDALSVKPQSSLGIVREWQKRLAGNNTSDAKPIVEAANGEIKNVQKETKKRLSIFGTSLPEDISANPSIAEKVQAIRELAKEYKLDAKLFEAQIRHESFSFRKNIPLDIRARSAGGCYGLGQIKVDTAKDIAKSMGIANFPKNDSQIIQYLFINWKQNLRMAAHYMTKIAFKECPSLRRMPASTDQEIHDRHNFIMYGYNRGYGNLRGRLALFSTLPTYSEFAKSGRGTPMGIRYARMGIRYVRIINTEAKKL